MDAHRPPSRVDRDAVVGPPARGAGDDGAALPGGTTSADAAHASAPLSHDGAAGTARDGPGPSRYSALREIERVWLGLQTPPLRERLATAGWRAEERTSACWRCGANVGVHEGDEQGCPACRRTRLPWDRLVRLGPFEGVLRDAVHDVKFTRWRRLGDDLGRMLGARVSAELERAGVDLHGVAVVPVPMSMWRRLGRGIDHSRVIARGVAASVSRGACRVPVLNAMRKEYRPPQWSVPVGERGRNVARSMSVVGTIPEWVRTVLVVDDVATTRSTLRTACGAIRDAIGSNRHPAAAAIAVWAAVIAVTPDKDRGGEDRREESGSEGVSA
jgi:predicted amidophosphoribosyltransferase